MLDEEEYRRALEEMCDTNGLLFDDIGKETGKAGIVYHCPLLDVAKEMVQAPTFPWTMPPSTPLDYATLARHEQRRELARPHAHPHPHPRSSMVMRSRSSSVTLPSRTART